MRLAALFFTLIALAAGLWYVGPVTWQIGAPLIEWINRGFLTIFFFLIGIHTNHELSRGALSEPGAAMLPVTQPPETGRSG